jgi:hypothetical protein
LVVLLAQRVGLLGEAFHFLVLLHESAALAAFAWSFSGARRASDS